MSVDRLSNSNAVFEELFPFVYKVGEHWNAVQLSYVLLTFEIMLLIYLNENKNSCLNNPEIFCLFYSSLS